MISWSFLALSMNIFYNNELRGHLIGQDFEVPPETLKDVDIIGDIFTCTMQTAATS